jgi:hypothetical protein
MKIPPRRRAIRIYFAVSSGILAFVLFYVAFVFLSRWQSDRQFEEQAAARKRVEAQSAFEAMGGNNFEILNFYAAPGFIKRGESLQLCYGTSNAKSVRIDPEIKDIRPALSRCVRVAPQKTTTYTLTAEDSAGHAKTATVLVQVR